MDFDLKYLVVGFTMTLRFGNLVVVLGFCLGASLLWSVVVVEASHVRSNFDLMTS